MILSPNRCDHPSKAIQTNQGQGENTGKHGDEHNEGEKLAHDGSIRPVFTNIPNHVEKRAKAAQEISKRQIEKPNCINGPLHLQSSNIHDKCISRNAED
ncbi:hypothetical protein QQF64_002816 [Cirrhinus molitorella]|uniref:Uncharacterized protein n=1 Tax=Cirrhinus molitorella TaxID=172907 RepID=A0ABR3MR91_9TELE